MSKSQQKLVELLNQDLSELYNNHLLNSMLNSKELNFQFDGQKNFDLDQSAILTITPLYQYQQKTIELQQTEIENLKISYNKLLAEFNEHELKQNEYKQSLSLKSSEVDELKQTLQMEVVDMKAELLKCHHRIQTSLMNVNKRLEEEISKLKSSLNEEMAKNQKLNKQIDCLQSDLNELKQVKLDAVFQYEIINKPDSEEIK
ncbi:unnamed protein product [Brachionus calyciflorus]|uniref:Uncharacterized protein n=1 Tax=Brachionus calyciflorus TaxID=104777 RepID=A0A814QFY5_9BILA|nr:unnamed protein product [Brachionus calyciflorus]